MIIARQKKDNNIAEYVLYMWQLEDIFRTFNFDMQKINTSIVEQFAVTNDEKTKILTWYEQLIEMMQAENITPMGHLRFVSNTISELSDLHLRLLNSYDETKYKELYYKAIPNIALFRSKLDTVTHNTAEIMVCFTALYNLLLLRLQKKTISDETTQAMETISDLLALLTKRYHQLQVGELEL